LCVNFKFVDLIEFWDSLKNEILLVSWPQAIFFKV